MGNITVRIVLLFIAALMSCADSPVLAVEPEGKAFFYDSNFSLPFTRAMVNNTNQHMLIDTCSTVSLLFAHTAKSARLTNPGNVRVANTRGLSIRLTGYPDSQLSIPGLPVRRMTVYTLGEQDPSTLPETMAGIIGLDYLQDFVIHMRESAGILQVTTPDKREYESADWQPLRFLNRVGHPVVSVPVSAATRIYFRIDTGFAGSLSLNRETIEELSMSEVMHFGGETEVIVAGGITRTKDCRVNTIELGGQLFRNVPGHVGQFNLIGLQLLSQFEVLIDFPNRRISLVPDPNAKPLDFRPGGSGLTFHHVPTSDGLFSVSKIEKGSAGEAAGIEIQDKLVAIDGRSVKGFQSPIPVYRLLQGEGRTIPLEFSRNGEPRRVELTLRYSVPYPPEWPPAPARAPLLPDLK